MSTDGLHLGTVAMLQGSSHLRVQSSAEFQVAAGAVVKLMPSLTTFSGAGNKGSVSKSGLTVWTCTGTGNDSTCIATLPAPIIGAVKTIMFRCVNATSNTQRLVTSSKGVKIGTSNTSILATSHANKIIWGAGVELIGVSTFRWLIKSINDGQFALPSTETFLSFTSSTG